MDKMHVDSSEEKYSNLEALAGIYWQTLFIYSVTGCCVWATHPGTADT